MTVSSGELEFRVRYAETDQMGVVHHSRYAVYFEMGRTELLRGTGYSYRDMEEAKAFLVVAKLEVKYHAPARYDDLLRLKTTVTRLTRARIEHAYELYRVGSNQLLTSGATTLACVDADGRPTAIPDSFFEKTGLPMP